MMLLLLLCMSKCTITLIDFFLVTICSLQIRQLEVWCDIAPIVNTAYGASLFVYRQKVAQQTVFAIVVNYAICIARKA